MNWFQKLIRKLFPGFGVAKVKDSKLETRLMAVGMSGANRPYKKLRRK